MGNRRLQIVDAAARLIGERGYTQTSVEDVIRASGLSGKSHFYHYFASKEELGYAVLDRQLERLAEHAIALERGASRPPLERLDAFIDAAVALQADGHENGGSPFVALAAEMSESHEGFRAHIARALERWVTQVELLLRDARSQLQPGVDAARLARFARFVIATLEGAVLVFRVTRDRATMLGIVDDLKRVARLELEARGRAPAAESMREPAAQSAGGAPGESAREVSRAVDGGTDAPAAVPLTQATLG